MSSLPKTRREFRPYRLTLMALYGAIATGGALLLIVSIVGHLFFRKPAIAMPTSRLAVENPDPMLLLNCNSAVSKQLSDLTQMSTQLLTRTPEMGVSRFESDWKEFSATWRDEQDRIEARCRFSDLADTQMGAAYDRMAQVHEALPSMRLRYSSLLATFANEHAAELSEMRQALKESHTSLQSALKDSVQAPSAEGQP